MPEFLRRHIDARIGGSTGAGPRGYTGDTGPTGATGPEGPTGSTGPQGLTGPQGSSGATGPQGPTGATGSAGADGLDGATGADGPMGATGPQGPSGADGVDGATGPQGLQGPQGTAGSAGATGPQGPQGVAGADGVDGDDGLDGAVGATGPQGPQGDAGVDGVDGVDGAVGATGPQGSAGDNGATGATGPAGPAPSGTGFVRVTAGVLDPVVALAAVASSGSASDLATGTLPIARIAAGDVTYSKIQNVSATDKVLGRSSGGAGVVEEIALTAAGRALIDDADAAAQRTTLGLVAVASSGSAADLSTGTLPAGRMPAHTGDVTTVAGAVATTIAASAVTLAKMADVAASRFIGRITGSTGAPEAMTGTEATSLLNTRTETTKGLMPANMGVRGSLATNKSIANTLTQVIGFTAAANTLAVGTVIRFKGYGLLTNTTSASTSVLTLRINAASLGATIEASWQCVLGTTARTNCPFVVEGAITIISTGAGGTAWGVIAVLCNTTTALALPTTMVTAAVTANTTQSNVVELTCISGAATTTWNFIAATIEIVQP